MDLSKKKYKITKDKYGYEIKIYKLTNLSPFSSIPRLSNK